MERVNKFDVELFNSSCYGDLEGVKNALANSGRVNARTQEDFSPLLAAAQNGHTEICGLLLAHGSDVNEISTVMGNITPLHVAAVRGHEATIAALLSWGAEVNHQSSPRGDTPLHVACQNGHTASVLTLLKAGASMSLPNKNEVLPIHRAANRNRVEIVRILLEQGCSPDTVLVSKMIDLEMSMLMSSFLFSAQNWRDSSYSRC